MLDQLRIVSEQNNLTRKIYKRNFQKLILLICDLVKNFEQDTMIRICLINLMLNGL
jgi:hypothetical protein